MASDASHATASRTFGLICAALGAFGFAFKAVLVKAAYRYGVDATTLLALRMAYALPFFLLMGLAAERRAAERLTRSDWLGLAVLGLLGYYASSYLDFLGLRHISAGLERVILFTYPTMVVVFSALLQRQRLPAAVLRALALCYVGVACAVAQDFRAGGDAVWWGCTLVFASALCYAAYLMLSGPLLQRLGSTRVAAWATAVASLLALLQFTALRPVAALAQPWQVQLLSLAMALFSTVLPIWLSAEAIRRLGAGTTAIIGSLGPIFTMLLAAAFLGESLGLLPCIGAALVIIGVRQVATANAVRKA